MRSGGKRPSLNVRFTYPTMMKLGTVYTITKEDLKICKSREKFLEFCWYQRFSPGVHDFCYIGNKVKDLIVMHKLRLFDSYWVIKGFLIFVIAKFATPDYLKISLFWNKVYSVML